MGGRVLAGGWSCVMRPSSVANQAPIRFRLASTAKLRAMSRRKVQGWVSTHVSTI